MKFFRNVLGYFIAGLFVMGIWDEYTLTYGILGGFIGATIIIGPLWYLNHHIGLIHNNEKSGFVDMALGIGIAGIARDYFITLDLNQLLETLPTILLVTIGGILGGVCSAFIERDLTYDKRKKNIEGDR